MTKEEMVDLFLGLYVKPSLREEAGRALEALFDTAFRSKSPSDTSTVYVQASALTEALEVLRALTREVSYVSKGPAHREALALLARHGAKSLSENDTVTRRQAMSQEETRKMLQAVEWANNRMDRLCLGNTVAIVHSFGSARAFSYVTRRELATVEDGDGSAEAAIVLLVAKIEQGLIDVFDRREKKGTDR